MSSPFNFTNPSDGDYFFGASDSAADAWNSYMSDYRINPDTGEPYTLMSGLTDHPDEEAEHPDAVDEKYDNVEDARDAGAAPWEEEDAAAEAAAEAADAVGAGASNAAEGPELGGAAEFLGLTEDPASTSFAIENYIAENVKADTIPLGLEEEGMNDAFDDDDEEFGISSDFEDAVDDELDEALDNGLTDTTDASAGSSDRVFTDAERDVMVEAAVEWAVEKYANQDDYLLLESHADDPDPIDGLLEERPGLWASIKRSFAKLGRKIAKSLGRSKPSEAELGGLEMQDMSHPLIQAYEDKFGFNPNGPASRAAGAEALAEPLLGRDNVGGDELGVPELGVPDAPELPANIVQAFDAILSDPAVGSPTAAELGLVSNGAGKWWIQEATFGDWLGKQAIGLSTAPFVSMLMDWLDQNTGVAGAGNMVSLGLILADFMSIGDPFGLVLLGGGNLVNAFMESRQKTLENDVPDKAYGTRFGYVRDGDKWYPAVLQSMEPDTGLWATGNKMTMRYGTDMVWVEDGEGGYKPEFVGAKTREFVVYDDVLKEGTGGTSQNYNDMYNSARDWYWMEPDEAMSFISGEQDFVPLDDPEPKNNPYLRQLNDWRLAFDASRTYKSVPGHAAMGDDAYEDTYGGLSRGMQRILDENRSTVGIFNVGPDDPGWENALGYLPYLGLSDEDYKAALAKDGGYFGSADFPMSDYLLHHVLQTQLDALYKTQYSAAAEAGFDDQYGTGQTQEEWEKGVQYEYLEGDRMLSTHPTAWSTLYLDTSKDLPIANNSSELEEQIHTIEQYDDRTEKQRSYLVQKATTRYWMNQVSTLGGTNQLNDFLFKDDWNTLRYSGPDFTPWKGDWSMPWQNAGEGIMPELYYDDQVSDYWEDWTADASADLLLNTRRFIGDGLDPNHLAAGEEMPMSGGTVLSPQNYDTPMYWVDDYDGGTYLTQEEKDAFDAKVAAAQGVVNVATLPDSEDPKTVTWDDYDYMLDINKDDPPAQVQVDLDDADYDANYDEMTQQRLYFEGQGATPGAPQETEVTPDDPDPFVYPGDDYWRDWDGTETTDVEDKGPSNLDVNSTEPPIEIPQGADTLQDHHFDPPIETQAEESQSPQPPPEVQRGQSQWETSTYVPITSQMSASIFAMEHPNAPAPNSEAVKVI